MEVGFKWNGRFVVVASFNGDKKVEFKYYRESFHRSFEREARVK